MNQASSSRVSRELQGHVLLLGLDRVAKRNAFDLDLLNELSLAYGEFDRNDESRVAVVFAHGDHFTAGLDLANVSGVMSGGWQPPLGGCDPWGVFAGPRVSKPVIRSEEHTSELQSHHDLVCRLLLEKKKKH